MDHTFGGACGTRGVHDEQGMIEWDLFKIQLRLLLSGGQEVVKYTATNQITGSKHGGPKHFGILQWTHYNLII